MTGLIRRGVALAVIAVVATAVAGVAFAGASGAIQLQPLVADQATATGDMQIERSPFWFVEFPTAPLADGSAPAAVADDAAAFRAEASAEGAAYTERMRFQTLWNGVSIKASAASLAKIEKFGSVKAVYPVGIHRIPETTQVSPDLGTAIGQTGADIAQNTLGLTGKGVDVAVMDSGLDYHHPDLGGGFGPGKRVFKGFDFVGENYVGDNTPVPDPDPDDCSRPQGGNAAGHGTHVSGIIGANGAVKGVAPGVRFGAYRVFGCQGFTTDDIMIAAMERILKDDMDVLNMSIGDAFNNWPDTPTAAASDRLVRKGVVVVASIGNSQNSGNPITAGLYAAGAPGVGEDVIGVASFDNTHVALTTINITPAGITAGYGNAAAAPTAPTTGSLPLAKTGTPTTPNDGCVASPAGTFTGRAVLIRRGTCTFHAKALNAQNAGAAAVVLYNNVAGRISPTVAGTPAITIPVVAVSDTEGVAINNAIDAGPQTLNWTAITGSFPNPTANLLSSFTSWGVAADLSLKPDIGAPGGLIRSTYPLEYGTYTTISGTSMSSPHVAGAAALLLESWKGKGDDDDDDDDGGDRAELVRDIFQNSADPQIWSGNPALGLTEAVTRQGAGMIDIDDAILAKTLVTPGKLSLGESANGAVTKTLKIRNNGSSSVTYALSAVPAISPGPGGPPPAPPTTYPFTFGFFLGDDTVTFSKSSVTVKRRDSERVRVTISPDATLPDKTLYGGYIVLVPSDGSPVLRVPYAGFKGDYQSVTVLSSASGLPLITDEDFEDHIGPWSLVDAANTPNLIYQLTHQARSLDILVVRESDGAVLGRAAELERLARSGNVGLVFAFPWDGTYLKGTRGNKLEVAADGAYRLRLVAEKPLASRKNPAHFETQTSPVFTIDRP